MTPEDYQSRKQNQAVQKHIASIIEKNGFDYYVTVTFAHGLYGPLRRHHVRDAERMVKGYVNKLRTFLYGRRTRENKKDFMFACWFEDKDKFSNTVPLHAHMLLLFPKERVTELTEETKKYWTKVGNNSVHRFFPSIDIRLAYNPEGASNYSCKNNEDGFATDNMILFGISNSRD